jgi:hypothetical protein
VVVLKVENKIARDGVRALEKEFEDIFLLVEGDGIVTFGTHD